MRDGIEAELAECQRPDARHMKRLARLFGRLSERPVGSLPPAGHGWAETVAASRFLNTPDIGVQEMLSGHPHATLERLRTQAVVFLVQDTTVLNDGTTQPKAAMGTVKLRTREESLLHPTVALTPERVNVGVVGMNVWPRPEQPVAPPRNSKPVEEKERYRGREGYRCAGAVNHGCPATLVVHLADRDGASQEWVVAAMRREPEQRAAWSIRATCHRRLVPGAAPRYFWAERPQTPAWGTRTIELARQPERPPRPGTLSGTATPVTFRGARRPGGPRPPVTGRAGYAQASCPPQGEDPLAWGRRTSLPVTDFPRACPVVPGSRCRWDMERWFRGLKQGGQSEPLRVQTEPRVLKALALYVLVAWRSHNSTMAGRAYPEGSCEVVFAPQAWSPLSTRQPHWHPPPTPPPRREMGRNLAQLGGVFARQGDGEPGINAIWQGYQRRHDCIYAIDTSRTVNALERNV